MHWGVCWVQVQQGVYCGTLGYRSLPSFVTGITALVLTPRQVASSLQENHNQSQECPVWLYFTKQPN